MDQGTTAGDARRLSKRCATRDELAARHRRRPKRMRDRQFGPLAQSPPRAHASDAFVETVSID
jgi:hypothetical protein